MNILSPCGIHFFLIPFGLKGLKVAAPRNLADTVLVFFSIYFTHLRLLISKLLVHLYNRIFRLCKSSKAAYR